MSGVQIARAYGVQIQNIARTQNVYVSIPLHKFKIKEANSGRNWSIDIRENAERALSLFMAVIHYFLRKSCRNLVVHCR